MATESESETSEKLVDFGETASDILDAYKQMPIPLSRYIGGIVVPAILFFFLTIGAAAVLQMPLMVRLPMPLLGTLLAFTALIYPKLIMDQRRKRMQAVFHLYVTHMTVLSTTNIDRVEVFRRIAQMDDYGPLSEETRRIVQLVDTWNQSLDDACRRRAKKIPSDAVTDFFDRLAYTINAGESLSSYLVGEQSEIIKNYATIYEGQLGNLEVMKDLYLSMILSVTFALVFATVLPVISGTDPTLTVSAVVVMYAFIQIGFMYAIYTVSPSDPLWHFPEERETPIEKKLKVSVSVGVALSFVVIIGMAAMLFGMTPIEPDSIPLPIYAAMPTTPLLIPGLSVRGEEAKVKGRDEEYVSFIRALGASETARQTTTTAVLSTLRRKDFGPLTENINELYTRLKMRLSPEKAWRFFTADAHSYLIQKFSEMYLVGRQMGGDPKHLGELISENMNEVLQLREQRSQSTMTLIGVIYGITAAATFAFFIGLGIVQQLSAMTLNMSTPAGFDFNSLINTEMYNIPLIEFLLTLTILVNSTLSSLIIRIVDGGHKVNAFMHFVFLTWLGGVIGSATLVLVGSLLGI